MSGHDRENCGCDICMTYRFNRSQAGGSRGWTAQPTGGTCGCCGGTGDCVHCRGGYYPRRDGSMAQCGKCRGRGNRKHPYMCHACRGRGYGGSSCSVPTIGETEARQKGIVAKERTPQPQRKKPTLGQVIGTTAALYGAVAGHGLAAGALPGQEDTAKNAGQDWKNASRQERRDDQTRRLRRSTRDKGTRDRGSGQQ